MVKQPSLLIALFLILYSCSPKNKLDENVYRSDSEFINRRLKEINTPAQLDSLIAFGLYNLGFEVIKDNPQIFTDSLKCYYAFQFAENGEFDKSKAIANTINKDLFISERNKLSLFCALKMENNILASQLFNNLKNNDISNVNEMVDLLLYQAYLAHNKREYHNSIKLNEKAVDLINKNKLSNQILAKAYRRLGNDYNDIFRYNIDFPLSKDDCYNLGLQYYNNELNILKQKKPLNRNKLALNYLTTGMLCESRVSDSAYLDIYDKVMSELTDFKKNKFIVTRNPIYSSIALTQLGSKYFKLNLVDKMDSVDLINERLMSTRSLYRINNKESKDIYEYFRQICFERKINYELNNEKSQSNLALRVLNLSGNSKYANQNLNRLINDQFGIYSGLALKNYILLNELLVYGVLIEEKSIINMSEQLLKKYEEPVDRIIKKNKTKINDLKLNELVEWCFRTNSTIVDYQILFGGELIISTISENGLEIIKVKDQDSQIKKDIEILLESTVKNQISIYEEVAFRIYDKLKLDQISSKNIVICTDEYMEKIPFDALISSKNETRSWSKLEYLIKTKNIHQLTNINTYMDISNRRRNIQVDIWTSKKDESTLPYNKNLLKYLVTNFSARINNNNPRDILHILGHTNRSVENEIEFRFFNRIIATNSEINYCPRLVILQGCSSGDGVFNKVSGSNSLTRNFIYSGINAVIYSIWDADNESSSVLFRNFYRYLYQGKSYTEALRFSKKTLILDYLHPEWSNPYYWANFQLNGQDLMVN